MHETKIDNEHITFLEELLASHLSDNRDNYKYSAAYNLGDFPLPLYPAFYSGCSKVVDAGHPLGRGRFCDYMIIGAASTIVIWYNRFESIA